jgi:hypothetical protein
MIKFLNPDEVPAGYCYLAWVNGTILPSFWLLEKDKNNNIFTWRCTGTQKKVPRNWIAAVYELPNPDNINLDDMDETND